LASYDQKEKPSQIRGANLAKTTQYGGSRVHDCDQSRNLDESNHPVPGSRHMLVERGESIEVVVLKVHRDRSGPLPNRLLNVIVEVCYQGASTVRPQGNPQRSVRQSFGCTKDGCQSPQGGKLLVDRLG